ncbi:MAG: FAD-dependent oxidoreductase [Candidatus Bathyarchaeota archaeon]|nr:FAD-dependent oxidoreductase [Candidatus Bathyarchaeota archaeon]
MKFETTLKETVPRTHDVTSFRFPRPPELSYKAGQYMLVTIRQGEKELMHPFSISSSPTETDYIEFTKKFTQHEYSLALKTLKPGDCVSIDAPHGQFTFEGEKPKIALLTGGIGITPVHSIVRYCTDMKLDASIVLFYGCRTPSDVAFNDEFAAMQKQNKNLKRVFTVNEPSSDWKGAVGNITLDLVKKELPDYKDRIFYACGPPGMVTAMINLIKELGLPETQLKLESFAGYT